MRRLTGVAVSLALSACGAGMPGGAGDSTPLTGLERNVEPVPMLPSWRLALAEGPVYRLKPHELAAPAYSAALRRVAVGTTGGDFVCADAGNGRILWQRRLTGGVSSTAIFDGDRILAGTDDGQLIAFDAMSGETRWKYAVQGAVQQAPVLAGDLAVFVDGTNSVYAIARQDGSWRWQYRRDLPADFALAGESQPLVVGNRLYAGFSDGHMAALDVRDGAVLWTRDLAPEHDKFQDVDSAPVLLGDTLFAASAATGVYALSPDDGAIRFTYPVTGVTRMTAWGGDLVLSVDRGEVWRLSPQGKPMWRTRLPGGAPNLVTEAAGVLAVPMNHGALYFLRPEDGRPIQHFVPGLGLAAPITAGADGNVFMLSNSGVLYAFRTGA